MREASVSLWLVVSAVMNASAPRRSIDSFLDKCAEGGAEENKYGRSSMDRPPEPLVTLSIGRPVPRVTLSLGRQLDSEIDYMSAHCLAHRGHLLAIYVTDN